MKLEVVFKGQFTGAEVVAAWCLIDRALAGDRVTGPLFALTLPVAGGIIKAHFKTHTTLLIEKDTHNDPFRENDRRT